MKLEAIKNLLEAAAYAYYNGNALILQDEQYDKLSESVKFETVGSKPSENTGKHLWQLFSLKKHFIGEGNLPELFSGKKIDKVDTPKLDGAAAAIYFVDGYYSHALTRGDGLIGQVITDKILYINNIPNLCEQVFQDFPVVQVVGEIVASKDIPNSRNYASGLLNRKDTNPEDLKLLYFYAYGVYPFLTDTYQQDMWNLEHIHGFKTVLDHELESFKMDGTVTRVNSNSLFNELGYTNHHPRGAIAIKNRKAGVPTTIKDVVWQVGKSGRITPVAILEPVNIDGAMVSKATLNNPGFIRALDLHIGDRVEVIRSGEIIPTILGKWEDE